MTRIALLCPHPVTPTNKRRSPAEGFSLQSRFPPGRQGCPLQPQGLQGWDAALSHAGTHSPPGSHTAAQAHQPPTRIHPLGPMGLTGTQEERPDPKSPMCFTHIRSENICETEQGSLHPGACTLETRDQGGHRAQSVPISWGSPLCDSQSGAPVHVQTGKQTGGCAGMQHSREGPIQGSEG